jgi:hypothetical protein
MFAVPKMKQNPAHIGLATSDGRPAEERAVKMRRDLGEVFLAVLADPATVGIILNTDGSLWQARARGGERWCPAGTMAASRAELVTRTVATCLPTTLPLEESRLDCPIPPAVTTIPIKSPTAARLSSLVCVCCRPKPLPAAPTPLFRLCWRKVTMIRGFLKNAEREELRACRASRSGND